MYAICGPYRGILRVTSPVSLGVAVLDALGSISDLSSNQDIYEVLVSYGVGPLNQSWGILSPDRDILGGYHGL